MQVLVVYFFFVESKGVTLEEMAARFDGKNADILLQVREETAWKQQDIVDGKDEMTTTNVERI